MLSKGALLAGVRLIGQSILMGALALRLATLLHAGLRRRLSSIHRWDVPLAAGCLAWLLSEFVLTLFYVPSRSMQPTLEVLDGIAVSRLSYRFRSPQVDEIVVFALPRERAGGGRDLVKRIVAGPGDTIRLQGGVLYRNDVASPRSTPDPHASFAARRISPGCFFVMGDNRGNSMDSRVFGEISQDWLYGPVVGRYWPPSRWGRVR
jgi:signal peptidase I